MYKHRPFWRLMTPVLLTVFIGSCVFVVVELFSSRLAPWLILLSSMAIFVLGLLLLLGGLSHYIVFRLTRPQRRAHRYPDLKRILDLPVEYVTFSSLTDKHQVHGLYIACQGATTTIVLSPGYRRGLKDILEMCRPLWSAGHHVLAFEYHGHGSIIDVPITLGYQEVDDFLGAVAYAKRRDPLTHIGAIGYSMGAAVTLIGSARTQDVEAVVADSAFASSWNAVELALHQTLRLRRPLPGGLLRMLYAITDFTLQYRAGYRFHQVAPEQEIARIAPRPLLLIHGTEDTIVSPDDALRLYEAAHTPKYLWLIQGAQHTKGYQVDRLTYRRNVLAFLESALPVNQFMEPGARSRLASWFSLSANESRHVEDRKARVVTHLLEEEPEI